MIDPNYVDPTKGLPLNPNVCALSEQYPIAGFCGPYGVGKDHALTSLGYKSTSRIAGPLYELVETMAGARVNKAAPGWRDTLCKVGAWGRGEVSEEYPMTAERLVFQKFVRNHVAGYSAFGSSPDFWLGTAMDVARLNAHLHQNTGIPDVRYPNELEAVTRAGWPVFFVACRLETLYARRTAMGYAINSGERSERLANDIFARTVISKLQPPEVGITVLWSDEPDSCPKFATPMFLKS